MNDKFDFLKRFIGKQDRDLREADVRYQIIDNIFKNILAWPDDKTKCEDHVNSGFIDYTLITRVQYLFYLLKQKKKENILNFLKMETETNLFEIL